MQDGKRKYTVKRAALGKGLGLFASENIKKGEFIIEYIGKRIPTQDAYGLSNRYLFEVDDDITIDGATRKNIARYANHSCKPNVEAITEDKRINLYAKRNIQVGEELAFNYGKDYFNEFIKPHGCKCASCSPLSS